MKWKLRKLKLISNLTIKIFCPTMLKLIIIYVLSAIWGRSDSF